jgi:hypothetical protein
MGCIDASMVTYVLENDHVDLVFAQHFYQPVAKIQKPEPKASEFVRRKTDRSAKHFSGL